jgi:hypothetical protein
MAALTPDELANLAPVDIMVVSFPEPNFQGAIAEVLGRLIDEDVIRVIDLVLIRKDDVGNVEINEVEDLEAAAPLAALFDDDHQLLRESDLLEIAAELAPGAAAGVLVWENTWSARLIGAAHRSGGEVVAANRIPPEAVAAAAATTGRG